MNLVYNVKYFMLNCFFIKYILQETNTKYLEKHSYNIFYVKQTPSKYYFLSFLWSKLNILWLVFIMLAIKQNK
jgi:hypothetical protein